MKQRNLTVKGQVTIPKDVRDALGLRAGEPVEFDWNDRGEAVIRAGKPDPALSEQRRRDYLLQLQRVAEKYAHRRDGRTTDEIMRDLRGDDPFPP